MKKLLALVLVLALAVSLCACAKTQETKETTAKDAAPAATEGTAAAPAEKLPLEGKRIAYILNVVSTDIFQMAANAAKETASALGAECDVYFTDTDNVRFQDTVSTCANQGYDAMFLSHGNQETSFDLVTDLVGKARFIIWPLDRIGAVR